ncbi:hypothetical protein KA531_03070 [Candidatus Saccharibacteria bacterium]|nr:hypothetical protein [Candidatus Saccharibacteria bacterium]
MVNQDRESLREDHRPEEQVGFPDIKLDTDTEKGYLPLLFQEGALDTFGAGKYAALFAEYYRHNIPYNDTDRPKLSDLVIVLTGSALGSGKDSSIEGGNWRLDTVGPEMDGYEGSIGKTHVLKVSLPQVYQQMLGEFDGSSTEEDWETRNNRFNQLLRKAILDGLRLYSRSKEYPSIVQECQYRQRFFGQVIDGVMGTIVGVGVYSSFGRPTLGISSGLMTMAGSHVVNSRNRTSKSDYVPTEVVDHFAITSDSAVVISNMLNLRDVGNATGRLIAKAVQFKERYYEC